MCSILPHTIAKIRLVLELIHSRFSAPMARGSIGLLVLMGLAFSSSRADDLFPTYRDHLTMEEQSRQVISDMEDQARISVVSLTGSTSNYTVNLSGIVLLSLSLSAAVMLWGYLYTLFERNKNKGSTSNQDSYSGGGGYYKLTPASASYNYTLTLSGILILGLGVAAAFMLLAQLEASSTKVNAASGGGYYKRSVDDESDQIYRLPIILSNIHRRFEEAAVNELICRQRILCEIGSYVGAPLHSLTHNVNTFFSLAEKNETLKFELDKNDQARTFLNAWTDGKRGNNCKANYDKCLMKSKNIKSFLSNEN